MTRSESLLAELQVHVGHATDDLATLASTGDPVDRSVLIGGIAYHHGRARAIVLELREMIAPSPPAIGDAHARATVRP